jgi:transcription elongation factor GreA
MTTTNKSQVTKAGLEVLKSNLEQLKEKRVLLVDRLANARSQGDLSENSDYQSARDELEFLDGRIAELEEVLNNVEVVSSVHNGDVSVGTKVTVRVNGLETSYEIVGEWEADPGKKMISSTSPLGKALIGKKVGDKAEVEAPAGKVVYEILAIE